MCLNSRKETNTLVKILPKFVTGGCDMHFIPILVYKFNTHVLKDAENKIVLQNCENWICPQISVRYMLVRKI